MAKNSKKNKFKKLIPVWDPMVNITDRLTEPSKHFIEQMDSSKFVGVWKSKLYQVYVREIPTEGIPGSIITWLSIKRLDRAPIHDWRHIQQIKNEVCGPEREACELYPSESRLVDTSNQYHLWVLQAGHQFPFGYEERLVVDSHDNGSKQRPFEKGLKPDDIISESESKEMLKEHGYKI